MPRGAGAFCRPEGADRSGGPSGEVVTMSPITEAALFHRSRKALGLSCSTMVRGAAGRRRPQHPALGGGCPAPARLGCRASALRPWRDGPR
jgi:hypothetical protein